MPMQPSEPVDTNAAGGWTMQNPADFYEKWDQVAREGTTSVVGLAMEDLIVLGQPVKVATQVVAGTNYAFTFADGTTATVWEQTWMNKLELSKIELGPDSELELHEVKEPKKEKESIPEPVEHELREEGESCGYVFGLG